MSIETLLTLAVAAGILAVAAVLRFVILGSIRVALRVTGTQVWWLQKPSRWETDAGATPRAGRAPLRPRVAALGRATARESVFFVTAFAEGIRLAAVGIATWALAVAAWSTPRLEGAGRGAGTALATTAERTRPGLRRASEALSRSARSAASKVKPAFVVAVATVQHLVRLVAARAAAWVDGRHAERSARPGEPTPGGDGPRVIDLDRDFDPLTDDFPEDRVGSTY